MLTGANVGSIIKGRSGNPGQLQGTLDFENKIATIYSNTDYGIFGVTEHSELLKGNSIPVCPQKEIKVGKAAILSNISGEFQNYSIEISRVYSESDERNMLITVTDEKLIMQTGGIVQGMSGSPIIQNGKLIGAVTHVLVNEPIKGYAISVEKMLEKAFCKKPQMAA
jgi:stage IV sporulation protein B